MMLSKKLTSEPDVSAQIPERALIKVLPLI